MGDSSALAKVPLAKSADSLDVKLIESVNMLTENCEEIMIGTGILK